MSDCVHDNGEYCEVLSDKEVRQPCLETPLCEDYKGIVHCKDCKYWNKHHFVDIYVCSIHNKEGQYPYLLFEMSADDFCSRGEKR